MEYEVVKEKPKPRPKTIKKFYYDKEYWEKHFSWTMQNL